MSIWVERVRNHGVWLQIETSLKSIDHALERAGSPADIVDSLERLKTVVLFCKKRLSEADPVLVLPPTLDGLLNLLTQLNGYVVNFISSGDFAQVNAANSNGDGILNTTVSIVAPNSLEELSSIGESTASYRNTLKKHLEDALTVQQKLLERSVANDQKIAALETAITAEQQRLVTISIEQQTQFSAAQDKRASDFSAAQAEMQAKITASSSEQQTQFSTDQDSRRTAFSDFQRDSQQKLSDLLSGYDEKLKAREADFLEKEKTIAESHTIKVTELHKNYESASSEILEGMRTHKKEIESLVGVIGNLGVTSGYKKVADQARTLLYIWQGITVFALATLIGVAFFIAFPNEKHADIRLATSSQASQSPQQAVKEENSKANDTKGTEAASIGKDGSVKLASTGLTSDTDFYRGLATRIFLSLTCGIFATYAGRQASKFFDIEQRNRKLALELEALGPFIEPLDKSDRDKFRVQIGDRSFGVPDGNDSKAKEVDPVTIIDLIKSKDFREAFRETFAEVKDALKTSK